VAWTARTHTACDENIDLSAFPAAIVVKALAQATSPTHGVAWSLHLGSVQSFSHILVWAKRRPALAVMAPLICWFLINSMFKYAVPAIWRSLAAARLRADCPSGNAPTTQVRRLISRRMRSSGLLLRILGGQSLVDRALHETRQLW
jgi:hypothetical protein